MRYSTPRPSNSVRHRIRFPVDLPRSLRLSTPVSSSSPAACADLHTPRAAFCFRRILAGRLFIINKSGGLIYYKDYGSAGRTDTNDSLRLASLWHSMHAISQQLSPTPGCEGIDLLQAHNFDLHCFQSLTGTKFFAVCETGAQNIEVLLKVIYELYTDFVLKNPFYEMEMPIRCELFDLNLAQVLQKDRVALLGR
uniref:Trafficking protein particle complex subunit n=1 Tax=Leersia perrieri TaxID=77586 RepID=A0A0D9WM00_9ORYZ